MNMSLDQPRSASCLLALARQDVASSGELVKLIMTGNLHVDSWIIENRILPALQEQELNIIRLQLYAPDRAARSAQLIPLADGSAFACNASGLWVTLAPAEAKREIEYIGYRYAPRNHWGEGFDAFLQPLGENPRPASPAEVAACWARTTGIRPEGFEEGILDEIQSVGIDAVDTAFHVQGCLGL